MTSKEREQHAHDEKVVRSLLNTNEGEVFMRWLKHEAGVEAPIYSSDKAYDQTTALLLEGGRHLYLRINSIKTKTT